MDIDSKDKDNAAYLKRREQVRRAQRTHRERKETYIKTLENEVLQLRTNKGRTAQGTRSLLAEVERLRYILDQHGIPYENTFNYALFSQASERTGHSSSPPIHIGQDQPQLLSGHIGSPQQGSGSEFNLSESDIGYSMPIARNFRRSCSQSRERELSYSETNSELHAWDQGYATADTATDVSLIALDLGNVDMDSDFIDAPAVRHFQSSTQERSLAVRFPLDEPVPHFQAFRNQSLTPNKDSQPTWSSEDLGPENLFYSSDDFQLSESIASEPPWFDASRQRNPNSTGGPSAFRRNENGPECYRASFTISEDRDLWPGMN